MVNLEDAPNCSVSNNTIYASSTQTQQCNVLKSTGGSHIFSSFKPYSYKFGSISGDCCYLETDNSSCSQISKNLTEIYKYDCSGCTDSNGDSIDRPILCGVKPVIFESGNLKELATLILLCFISTFAYALFVVGPFIFWMKQAPTIRIKKPNCYNGMSVLERHYPHDSKKLPYNYNILDECNGNKSNTQYPSFDKCPTTPSVKSGLDRNNSLSGETTWDMITKPFGGFPYNLLPVGGDHSSATEKKEKQMNEISSKLFLLTWCICAMYFAIMGAPYFDSSSGSESHHRGQAVGLTIFIVFIYLILFIGINSKFIGGILPSRVAEEAWMDQNKVAKAKISVKRAIIAESLFLLFTIILSIIAGVYYGNPNKHKYALIFIGALTIGLFGIMSYISYLPNQFTDKVNGKELLYNFKFFDVFLKMWYYLKKSFVFSIRKSLRWGRKVPYKFFDTIKEWPLPTSLFIIFGWIPHIVAYFVMVIRIIVALFGGLIGAFGNFKRDEHGKRIGNIPDTFFSGIIMCSIGAAIMTIVNAIFHTFSYHFIPLLYPQFMTQMIKCNIKTFTFVFGMAILSAMWTRHNAYKYNYVPVPVLICMTITFAIITLYNIIISYS
tara:strand:+ start:1422 stop:3245 length:1824 start_codon:yes stop_codon:yes gene_type:complete